MAKFVSSSGTGSTSSLQASMRALDGIAGQLMAAGQANRAFALREAQKRLASTSSLGVNSFARARALADMKAKMMAAGREADAKIQAQLAGINAQLSSQMANMSQRDKEFMANMDFKDKQLAQQASQFDKSLAQQKTQADQSAWLRLQQQRNAMLNKPAQFMSPSRPSLSSRLRPSAGAGTGMSEDKRQAWQSILQKEKDLMSATAGGFLAKPYSSNYQPTARSLSYVLSPSRSGSGGFTSRPNR